MTAAAGPAARCAARPGSRSPCRDVAAAGALECRGHLRAGQPRGPRRVRGLAQQLQGVRGVQVLEGRQRGREVLPQLVPQPLHLPGPLPDQRLVRPGHHLDRAGIRTVTGHRAELVRVGPHHVRQHVRVAAVALCAGDAVPFPVPRGLQRVHRVHHIPGRDQRGHPRAAVGLDPDHHLRIVRVIAQLLPDQGVQPGNPRHALRQPLPGQHPSGLVHQLHIVMVLSPVIPHEQPHPLSRPRCRKPGSSLRENNQRPNETVLPPSGRARHPSSDQLSRLPAGARSFGRAQGPGKKCSPAAAPGTESAVCGPGRSH